VVAQSLGIETKLGGGGRVSGEQNETVVPQVRNLDLRREFGRQDGSAES